MASPADWRSARKNCCTASRHIDLKPAGLIIAPLWEPSGTWTLSALSSWTASGHVYSQPEVYGAYYWKRTHAFSSPTSLVLASRCVSLATVLTARPTHPRLPPPGLTLPGVSGWSAFSMHVAVLGVAGTCSTAGALLSVAVSLGSSVPASR